MELRRYLIIIPKGTQNIANVTILIIIATIINPGGIFPVADNIENRNNEINEKR